MVQRSIEDGGVSCSMSQAKVVRNLREIMGACGYLFSEPVAALHPWMLLSMINVELIEASCQSHIAHGRRDRDFPVRARR